MPTPLSRTLRIHLSHYTLSRAQLDGLASEFYGRILEGAMSGDGGDDEDEIVIEFAGSALDKIDLENALWGFRKDRA